MHIEAGSVEECVVKLPGGRQPAFRQLLATIRDNIDPDFAEVLSYAMPSWAIPHSIHPKGYHCDRTQPVPFLALGNQKNFIALYHMGLYVDSSALEWFQDAYRQTGYKLDMGKSCIRFKNMDKIPYEIIAELARRISLHDYLDGYTAALKR